MAYKDKTMHNSRNGQSFRFLHTAADTDGELLEMESSFSAHSKEPPLHYHPVQDETFTVLEGELTVRLGDGMHLLRAGDRLDIPRNQRHAMWNAGSVKAVVNWKVRPALDTEHFLETVTGLANDGKTNERGVPPLLQTSLLAQRYARVFRLARPSFALQRAVFLLLTPLARMKGYKAAYSKYID
ncbi:MAG: cupin domain-containing protein [Chitinophagaceae bacterium]|nr:MAG: cupin domain-containing protein [Chitinophagaceae bacterium]